MSQSPEEIARQIVEGDVFTDDDAVQVAQAYVKLLEEDDCCWIGDECPIHNPPEGGTE